MKILITLLTFILCLNAQNVNESIYTHIIMHDIKEANQNLAQLSKMVEKNASEEIVKEGFTDLMISWKKVQTLYLAGDLNEEAIDIPRYIDIFHNGKENIYSQLDRILRSSDALDMALFKNSTKSINALEYLLFKPSAKTDRQKEMTLYILKHIGRQLEEIENVYQSNKAAFTQEEQKTNAVIMNALIESSYKLKEWRVGDPAGLSRKYKNHPDNNRSEYPVSKLSYKAIEAILQAHQAIIGEEKFSNFSTVVSHAGADKTLSEVRRHIEKALQYLHAAPAYDFSSKEIKALYGELTALHNAYFISIIGALKITSKILDSDGD